MLTEFHAAQPGQQKGGGHEGAQQVHGLSNEGGPGHFRGGQAVRLARLRKNGKYAEVDFATIFTPQGDGNYGTNRLSTRLR